MAASLSVNSLIPLSHPYNVPPYNLPSQTATNIPVGTVDWVVVEIRTGLQPSDELISKVGFLMADGQVRDTDGISDLQFELPPNQGYFVVLRHRNHLDVINAQALPRSLNMTVDFTTGLNSAYGSQSLKLSSDGKAMLFAGDVDQNHVIQTTDYDKWKVSPAQLSVYKYSDFNLDGSVQTTDYDKWYINKSKIGVAELGY